MFAYEAEHSEMIFDLKRRSFHVRQLTERLGMIKGSREILDPESLGNNGATLTENRVPLGVSDAQMIARLEIHVAHRK